MLAFRAFELRHRSEMHEGLLDSTKGATGPLTAQHRCADTGLGFAHDSAHGFVLELGLKVLYACPDEVRLGFKRLKCV
jgi:hypothetical protein